MTTGTGAGYALPAGEGRAIWFLGTRMTVKAGAAETGGAFTLVEQELPPGFAPPPHIHHQEDEAFYILDGSLTVRCGEETWEAGAGTFVYLPRGVPHGFSVQPSEQPARLLQLTTPAGFELFAADVGRPAEAPGLPPPAAPDVENLLAAFRRYHLELADGPPGE